MSLHDAISAIAGFQTTIWNVALAHISTHIDFENVLAVGFFIMLLGCIYREARKPFLRRSARAIFKSYRTNVATFFLNDLSLGLLSLPSLYFVADRFSSVGLLGSVENGPLKFVLCFLLLDFALYCWHWAMHHDDGLWVFHKLHHSDPSLNVTTGLRYDVGELILEVIVRATFVVAIGVNAEIMLLSQAIISLFVLLHHTNTTLPGERWLAWVFIVPRLHRIHHSVLREEHDSNYGAVFSVWDRMFGTLKQQEPTAIGLLGPDEPRWLDWLTDWIFADDAEPSPQQPLPISVRHRNAGSH